MAADHDQVAAVFLGEVVDFLARLAVSEVGVFLGHFRVFEDQPVQALLGLVKLLLLQLGKVHGHVAAKGHGHRFDDVHQ
ncbi:hypothetical protein PS898_05436 [Pseudomonas fluorescens]|nr:hypothetical protein PS898_05436 [Pseudomonas fluorescens]